MAEAGTCTGSEDGRAAPSLMGTVLWHLNKESRADLETVTRPSHSPIPRWAHSKGTGPRWRWEDTSVSQCWD